MKNSFAQVARRVSESLQSAPSTMVVRNAVKLDAKGERPHSWLYSRDGKIRAVGTRDADLETALEECSDSLESVEMIDADGALMVPGFIDIHSHGGWGVSFDDGEDAIGIARAAHAVHGTTRQVLSLITNPLETMCSNLRQVKTATEAREDVLGSHLEGPFLALSRKGAHDPECLKAPQPEYVDELLEAADGSLRQITLAPELDGGFDAIRRLANAGVRPAIGHSDMDYDQARTAIDAGATILTHIFNAMNGLHHRAPGPIPAVLEDPRVSVEIINDGFHVQDPVVRLAAELFASRLMFVTDSMSATGCPDGAYKLGALDVVVKDGHARLVSNGAIAGSTLTLDVAFKRAVTVLGMSPVAAIRAATLNPAHALGLDRPNGITQAPLGLLSPGFAADIVLLASQSLDVQSVWCAGRKLA